MQNDAPRDLRVPLAVVVGVTLLSRLAYWPPGLLGKDAEAYINSMKLDASYNVPMPGNVGWVLMGRLFATFLEPQHAFTVATVLVSVVGAAYLFLLCSLLFERWLAVATAIGTMLSPMVWYHGVPVMTYVTWIAIPPAIAYYGVRYWRERQVWLLHAAALATGVGTILRPDMVAFAGPMLGGILIMGRAPLLKGWLVSLGVCIACCAIWFFITAAAIGSVTRYLEMVRGQTELIDSYGIQKKGLVEGLVRNGGKFAIILTYSGLFVAPLAVLGFIAILRAWRMNLRAIALGMTALAPSLYFGVLLFMGNAGLVLPTVVAAFLLASYWMTCVPARQRFALPVMAVVAALGAAQFVLTPVLPVVNQRSVILNSMLLGYSGNGIRQMWEYNLVDFGVESTVSNAVRQMRNPEPVPKIPDGYEPPEPGAR